MLKFGVAWLSRFYRSWGIALASAVLLAADGSGFAWGLQNVGAVPANSSSSFTPVETRAGGGGFTGPKQSQPKRDRVERDLSVGVFGQLTEDGIKDTRVAVPGLSDFSEQTNVATASAGTMATYREQFHPWLGFKTTFSYTHLIEKDRVVETVTTPTASATGGSKLDVGTDLYELSVAYAVESPERGEHFRPFAQLGGGTLLFEPNRAQYPGSRSFRGLGVAGAGVDCRLTDRLGLRIEYRGLLTVPPNWVPPAGDPNGEPRPRTLIGEPTVSLTYRFGAGKTGK